jgi:hypothetical protein
MEERNGRGDGGTTMDAWVTRLQAGYEAGYYRTEIAAREQTTFPWQNKTCKHCPFWSNSICQVYAEYRSSSSHTCHHFDPWNRATAQALIQERQWQGFRRWWEWFNDKGATR